MRFPTAPFDTARPKESRGWRVNGTAVMQTKQGKTKTMIPIELQDAFYAGKRGVVVKFVIDDSVVVTSGEYHGCGGAIISIEEVEPEVVYLVERGDNGASIYVPQKYLELV